MREKGTTMAAEEQNPEEQNPQGEASLEQLAPPVNENFKWYIIHAYSGFERKVKESLEGRVQAFGLQNKIGRVMIPTEPVTELVNGKKRTVERVFLPGYVLVEMEMSDETWHLVKNTAKVTGFVGGAPGRRPPPITEKEVQAILHQIQEGVEKPKPKVLFEVGEAVRVKEGPFTDFHGSVEEVNYDKNKLRVSVSIFGRSTPVELDFSQVEKA